MHLQTKYDTLGRMLKHTWEDTLPDKETAAAMGECLADIASTPIESTGSVNS